MDDNNSAQKTGLEGIEGTNGQDVLGGVAQKHVSVSTPSSSKPRLL